MQHMQAAGDFRVGSGSSWDQGAVMLAIELQRAIGIYFPAFMLQAFANQF